MVTTGMFLARLTIVSNMLEEENNGIGGHCIKCYVCI